MRLAAALLFSLVLPPVLADDVLTFTGVIEGRDIVVELAPAGDGAMVGRFAHLDMGGDIPLLAASGEAGVWVLHEEAPCQDAECRVDENGNALDPKLAAVWELVYDRESYLATGTRTILGEKPKSSPLELMVHAWRALDDGEEASAYGLHDRSVRMSYDASLSLDWERAPYEMVLLTTELETGATGTIDGAKFTYVIDPRSKFAFPRAVAFADGSPVDFVNEILAQRHGLMTLSAFDCLAYRYASYGVNEYTSWAGGTLGDYDSETVTLSYLSPRVVSWTQAGSLFCAGAHPYNHFDSYTVDVETGEKLDLSRIFSAWVARDWGAGPDETVDLDIARAAPDDYAWGPNAALIAYVRDHVPADLFDAELAEACIGEAAIADQLDIRFAEGPSAVFTLAGFPHVISVCNGDLFSVELSALEQFLTPEAGAFFPRT